VGIVRFAGVVAGILGSFAVSSFGQMVQPVAGALEPDALHLRAGKFTLNSATSELSQADAPLPTTGYHVIQLDGALTPERVAALRRAGISIGTYLPANAYIVRMNAGFRPKAALGGLGFVRWSGAFEKSWKLDPQIGLLKPNSPERQALAAKGDLKLTVVLFDGADFNRAMTQIGNVPGTIILDAESSDAGGAFEITIPAGSYPQLADLADVQWVEEAGEIVLRNDTNKWIVQTNVVNSTTVWDHGLHGEGQVGGLIDGPMRQTHCSFSDPGGNPIGPLHRKIVAYFGSAGSDGHGTHTAGTFVGDPVPAGGAATYRGIAYMAKVAFSSSSQLSSVGTMATFTQNHNAGARLHSNSWGTDFTTAYNTQVRDVDKFSFDNEEDLVLFAITNQNSVVYTPENAKNCVGVALTSDTPNQGSQCFSVGFAPTADGRRKPEVTAPGCSTWSSNSSTTCGFTNSGFSGTSMACPLVAGCGLIVRQYFKEGFYPSGAANAPDGFTPSGALIKAMLVNSATDMTGISGYPSVREGWGRVLLEKALYFAGDSRKLLMLEDKRNAVGLTTGQSENYNFSVTSNSEPLEVTLVWTEKEAAVSANPAYINNLNLVVTGPGGTYLGNVFSGGQSATGGSADLVNNTEQVLISAPAVGDYTVTVNAAVVNTVGPQGYALVATGAVSTAAPAPSVDSISPNSDETDAVVAVTDLLGANFQSGATVKLARSGFPDIDGTNVAFVNSGKLTCDLNLASAEGGVWDVVVTNPDSQAATLAGGFTVNVTCLKGDLNSDGFVNGDDISAFVRALINGDGTVRERCAGDVGTPRDVAVTQSDIGNFVCILLGHCGCGVPEPDDDGDGAPNCSDSCPNDPKKISPGTCGCGVADVDSDSDGTPDCNDGCPADAAKIAPGECGCGVPDTDLNENDIADCLEAP